MKKVLLVFDGIQFSNGAFEFARQLNNEQPLMITGIFMPQASYASFLSSNAIGVPGPEFTPLLDEEYGKMVQKNINRFEKLCQECKIVYKVHNNLFDFTIPEIKRESRFADLLIIGSETFFKNISKGADSYTRAAIHISECPVIVVPEKFKFPERVIIAYDGSESSVYAIKQFSYLFPDFYNKEVLLVYMNEKEEQIPAKSNMEELAKQHFSKINFVNLDIDPYKFFNTWMSEKANFILVCGSLGRTSFSELVKKSFVVDIMNEHRTPIFIAHR